MEEKNLMSQDKTDNTSSLFKQVIQELDNVGELKSQVVINLTSYDTSKMNNYKEGEKIYKGYTCKISTLKPSRKEPRKNIDINPSDKRLREAITAMYNTFDKLPTL